VVHFYYKGFLSPDEVGPPVVYHFNHPKELEVVGIVVLFGGGECGQVIGYRVALSQGGRLWPFILGEDSSNSVLQCVSLEVEYFAEVGLLQDWFANHPVSEFLKSSLLVVFPVPWHGLLCKVQKGSHYLRVVFDEVSVVACEAQEFRDLSYTAGAHPGLYFVDLGLFHFYHALRYSHT